MIEAPDAIYIRLRAADESQTVLVEPHTLAPAFIRGRAPERSEILICIDEANPSGKLTVPHSLEALARLRTAAVYGTEEGSPIEGPFIRIYWLEDEQVQFTDESIFAGPIERPIASAVGADCDSIADDAGGTDDE